MNFPIYLKFCNDDDHPCVLGYKRAGLVSYIVYFKDGGRMEAEYWEDQFQMKKHIENGKLEIIKPEEAALLFGEI
jgi:hypothetical protein